MIAASLYIIVCSARNRLRVRLRRLREPRYLLGAIAGVAYFYFTVFARVRGGRASRRPRPSAAQSAGLAAALQAQGIGLGAMFVLALAALAWVFPGNSGLLDFTPAETNFLITAPVTRRQLLLHRLMRSQIGLLFASVMPAIFFPSGSGLARVRVAVALWLVLVTAKVYFTGVTLARTRLDIMTAGGRWAALAPLAVVVAATTIVIASIWHAFAGRPVEDPLDAVNRLGLVATNGAAGVVMLPIVVLLRPLVAPWPLSFFAALVPAAFVLAATIAWVLRSDSVFEEAAAAVAARRSAARSPRQDAASRSRAFAWTLAPKGRTEGIFLWKNAMQVLRATTGAELIRYVVPLALVAVSLGTALMAGNRARGTAMTLCSFAIGAAMFTVLLGPQVVRIDLRDDLRHLEVLKTWPLEAAAVIRGEMLCAGALLTGAAWLAIASATILSAAGFPRLSLDWRLSGSFTAAVLAPALVIAQLTIHNAAAVLFPAWVPLGHSRPRGLDAMGQRLILFSAIVVALVFMMTPAALAGGVVWLAFRGILGAVALVPAAVTCAVIVMIEVLAATEVLGPAYERLDMLAVERSE
jgi:ABC-2 type transport system permease protein